MMLEYRECARHLWNSHFASESSYSSLEWDRRDRFAQILWLLFYDLVLVPLEKSELNRNPLDVSYPYTDSIDFIRVASLAPDWFELNVHGLAGEGQWTTKKLSAESTVLEYIDFFDWDELGYRDYQFARVKIAKADDLELEGNEGLVEVTSIAFSAP